MRSILLWGLGSVLGVLTVVALIGLPFWMFSAAAGSMMEPGFDPWAFPLLAAAPYFMLGVLWFFLWLIARATRPKPI